MTHPSTSNRGNALQLLKKQVSWVDRRFRWHRDSHPVISIAMGDVASRIGVDAAAMSPQDMGRILELLCADYVAGMDGKKVEVLRFPGRWSK